MPDRLYASPTRTDSMLLKIILGVFTFLYPFVVYSGLQSEYAHWLPVFLVLLLGLRWWSAKTVQDKYLVLLFLVGIAGLIAGWGAQAGLKFYPVLVNTGLLVAFGMSLLFPPSMVERLARLKEPDLPDSGVVYTRRVTQVWCVFFLLNGSLAAVTAIWASDEIWVLYNGMVAYILMGLLFAGEWLIRGYIRRRNG